MTDAAPPMVRGKDFSPAMVRALMRGTKTQTRRLYSRFAAAGAGRAGDRLYVRENWSTAAGHDRKKPADIVPGAPIRYLADNAMSAQHAGQLVARGRFRPGRYMPRWVSRITLSIESVAIERLQDIAAGEAVLEGIVDRGGGLWSATDEPGGMMHGDPIAAYRELWESIHSETGATWVDNPNVIVTTFTVQRGNVDDLS